MRWIQSTGRGREFRRGRAAWTSAAVEHLGSWRWPARRGGVWFVGACPLRMECEILRPRQIEIEVRFEDGRANAGRDGYREA